MGNLNRRGTVGGWYSTCMLLTNQRLCLLLSITPSQTCYSSHRMRLVQIGYVGWFPRSRGLLTIEEPRGSLEAYGAPIILKNDIWIGLGNLLSSRWMNSNASSPHIWFCGVPGSIGRDCKMSTTEPRLNSDIEVSYE